MLLDRIDIDAHGPLQRVELGPLAEHLNVVLAPDGSGKTAISRFIRDALVDRTYPLGMFSSSTGRVILGNRHGMVHCLREKDGTASGRRRVEFESRGEFRGRYDLLENDWLQGISQNCDAGSAAASLAIPEAIVDAVITDTSACNVTRVVSACVRSGLDSIASYQSLPLNEGAVYAQRNGRFDLYGKQQYERNRTLREELADVEAEMARYSADQEDYDSLVARRNRLANQLAHRQPAARVVSEGRRYQLQQRSTDLQQRARDLRKQQSELRRRVADVELDIASCDLGRRHPATTNPLGRNDYPTLCHDRDTLQHELDRVSKSLDACLSEAAEVGRTLRSFSSSGRTRHVVDRDDQLDRDALVSELRRVDDRLARLSRVQWLRSRRGELLKQMRLTDHTGRTKSPLSDSASRWLIRLSGGLLRRIDWSSARVPGERSVYDKDLQSEMDVRIDSRNAATCSPADRMLAVMAIRLAAGDFLAKSGRHVPLVLEIPHDLVNSIEQSYSYQRTEQAFREHGDHLRSNHTIAAALRDYVQAGRQILVLTSSNELSSQLARVGARTFQIRAHRVVHPHRPLWRSNYQGETYVGPHPHTYAHQDADVLRSQSERPSEHTAQRSDATQIIRDVDVNRDFDLAWRESQRIRGDVYNGFPRHEVTGDTSTRTDWARDGVPHRDGYYFADAYTTDSLHSVEQHASPTVDVTKRNPLMSDSPFYLSVDSPIDQAPSVDAVAAARLRGLKVTHVTHLMQRDPNRLSDALGLASVDAATIRRWQAECRLACRVPNLRGFDARVLVGCGVTTPGQLAATHPTELLHEVEAFLATDRGQQLLLSGTSQELSRITTWIATANSAAGQSRSRLREPQRRRRVIRTTNQDTMLQAGNPTYYDAETHLPVESSNVDSEQKGRTRRRRVRKTRSKGRVVASSQFVPYGASNEPSTASDQGSQRELRFHLHRKSAVVDAPSIGSRMSERLHEIGIETVDDLLAADPQTLASELDHHRVNADRVLQWQQQAELVCRIPMLRGHDAQLLVAAEVTTPEELAESDAAELFEIVDLIARSNQGKRMLRGGNPPDQKEVKDWIHWAMHQRSLRAA